MKLDAGGYADPKEFDAIAEATRKRVQQMVIDTAEIFDPAGEKPPHEAAALFWAQLSGVVTAAAAGLAGMSRFSTDLGRILELKAALHSQLDDAFNQALAAVPAA